MFEGQSSHASVAVVTTACSSHNGPFASYQPHPLKRRIVGTAKRLVVRIDLRPSHLKLSSKTVLSTKRLYHFGKGRATAAVGHIPMTAAVKQTWTESNDVDVVDVFFIAVLMLRLFFCVGFHHKQTGGRTAQHANPCRCSLQRLNRESDRCCWHQAACDFA